VTAPAEEPGGALTLFVSGASDLSARAIAGARELCDVHLAGRYELAVIDVHEDPAAVIREGVRVVPTLVRTRPLPVRRYVGDLARAGEVLLRLELQGAEPRVAGAADATD
jgi:circadian clock protein KaiB